MAGPPRTFAALLRARRGYLATIGAEAPHLIPVCFTWAGDVIYSAIDAKPKSSGTLQRMRDIESSPTVSFLVDRWDEDWSRLAWLQARGTAKTLDPGEETAKAKEALKEKYNQYSEVALDGPVIRIQVDRWIGWPDEGA
jgi:PPOX class probable F420-dependent enzyme